MGLTVFIIIYFIIASTVIAGQLTILGILRNEKEFPGCEHCGLFHNFGRHKHQPETIKNNKLFTNIIVLLIIVAILLGISYNLTGTLLFGVTGSFTLALAQVALYKSVTGLFVEQCDSHESDVVAGNQ